MTKTQQSLIADRNIFNNELMIPADDLYILHNEFFSCFQTGINAVLKPEILLCCSYDKTIKTKYVKQENKAYLLYDVHLLEVLGELSEVFLAKANIENAEKIAYRLIAEEYYIHTKIHETLYFGYQYRARYYKINLNRNNQNISDILLLQKSFILLHELTHWFFFRCDKEEKERQIIKNRQNWIVYFDQLIQKKIQKGDSKGSVLMVQMREQIATDNKLIEECSCDTFATLFLIENFSDSANMSKAYVAEIAFLCIQNLQLLAYIKNGIEATIQKQERQTKLSFEMTMRLIILKYHVHNYLFTYAKDAVEDYDTEILKFKDEYDEKILHPVLAVLDKSQLEAIHLKDLHPISIFDKSWNIYRELINSILNYD